VDLPLDLGRTVATRRVATSAGIGPSIETCQPTGSPENQISVSAQRSRWSPPPDATAQSQPEGVNTCAARPLGITGHSSSSRFRIRNSITPHIRPEDVAVEEFR
jgi:hypothetical protein